MNDAPPSATTSPLAAAPLFATAVALLVASMFAPVIAVMDEPLAGWETAYITAWGLVGVVWSLATREPMGPMLVGPMFLGTAANLSLLTSAAFGRRLRHRHAKPMLILAINGLAAGLVLPAFLGFEFQAMSLEVYGDLQVGYWMWIGTLALVAAGWWNVVTSQRRVRRMAQFSDSPPS